VIPTSIFGSCHGHRARIALHAQRFEPKGKDAPMADWIDACSVDEIDEEDVMRWDHAGRTYALYHSPDGEYFCTDGLCTHENVHLAGGLVMDYIIECPKHNGQFDYRTGEAKRAPVCVNLRTYPARVQGDRVQVQIG
jgi:3-phenylpropionate/trans-cinnamate dioxygenase ferredoxin subunit